MNKKFLTKKTGAIVVIFFLLISGFYFIYQLTPKDETPNETNKEGNVEILNIPKLENQKIQSSFQEEKFEISFNVPEKSYTIPKSLSIYEIDNSPLSEERITEIAKKLGFTIRPDKIKDAVYGETLTYFQNPMIMTVLPNARRIDYATNNEHLDLITKTQSRENVEKAALEFLESHGFIPSKDHLKFQTMGMIYIDEGGHTEYISAQKNIIRITFTQELNGVPLTGSYFTSGTVEVLLNSNLEIYSVAIVEIPNLIKKDDYPLKSYEEVKETFNQASLQSLDNGKMTIESFYEGGLQVQSATITKILVAYVQEDTPQTNILQPTLILEGSVLLSNRQRVSATFYLPAISGVYINE